MILFLSMCMSQNSDIFSPNECGRESVNVGGNHDDLFADFFILSLNKLVE